MNIIIEVIDDTSTNTSQQVVHTKPIVNVQSLLDIGYRHTEQIDILQSIQDALSFAYLLHKS